MPDNLSYLDRAKVHFGNLKSIMEKKIQDDDTLTDNDDYQIFMGVVCLGLSIAESLELIVAHLDADKMTRRRR